MMNWDSLLLHGVNATGKEIGRGAYGRVFEVNYEGTLCAAKEVHELLLQYAQGDDLQKIKDNFLGECQIWSTLRHPSVVQFLGVYYPARDQYKLPIMVMEKMQHSLRGLVEKYDNIPLNVKLSILDEVCLGLRYLHSRNPPIVHRDLTPNNILLGGHLEAKITDLGVAKVVKSDNQKTMTKLPGTPDFMPPEALSRRPVYGPALDVFSYGGVILNVTTQLWPEPTDRSQLNPDTDMWEIVSEVKRRQHFLDKMTGSAVDLKPLVMSCLDDNPKNRPPVAQVSMTIKRIKSVCCQKSTRDGMSPIVWLAEVSSEQQSVVTSSLTTALEEMTIRNEELQREVDLLKVENHTIKADNTQLSANNDEMKEENTQLTALLNKMATNNLNQIQQINSRGSEIERLRNEVKQLKQQLDSKEFEESTTRHDLFDGPVNIKWEEGAPAPVCGYGNTAVWLNGLVYMGGGRVAGARLSYIINCYDPVKNSWGPPIDTPYADFAMTTLNNKLLVVGGKDKIPKSTNRILVMDAGHLKNYNKMVIARSHSSAIGHQGMLIITGGLGDNQIGLSSTELFDSNIEQWHKCSDLPQPHSHLNSVIVDNTLYLLGGFLNGSYSSAVFTASLDTLSTHQLRWDTHQDTPWCCSASVSVRGTHLLVIGGNQKKNHRMISGDVCKLNKTSHRWEAIGRIPSIRSSPAAVCTPDDRVIVIGGTSKSITDTVYIGYISCKSQ